MVLFALSKDSLKIVIVGVNQAHGAGLAAVIHPGAGPSFMRAAALGPGHDAKAAAPDAWARTLDFLDRELSAAAP